MKIGDELYCICDYYYKWDNDKTEPIFLKYKKYKIIRSLITKTDKKQCFTLTCEKSSILFSKEKILNIFITQKEYRKQKLKKLKGLA